MSDDSENFGRAMGGAERSCCSEGAAGIGHVVDDDGSPARDMAHKDHPADFVGAGALFVD